MNISSLSLKKNSELKWIQSLKQWTQRQLERLNCSESSVCSIAIILKLKCILGKINQKKNYAKKQYIKTRTLKIKRRTLKAVKVKTEIIYKEYIWQQIYWQEYRELADNGMLFSLITLLTHRTVCRPNTLMTSYCPSFTSSFGQTNQIIGGTSWVFLRNIAVGSQLRFYLL